MQAILIAQAQGPTTPADSSLLSSQISDDNSFAPALAQASSDQAQKETTELNDLSATNLNDENTDFFGLNGDITTPIDPKTPRFSQYIFNQDQETELEPNGTQKQITSPETLTKQEGHPQGILSTTYLASSSNYQQINSEKQIIATPQKATEKQIPGKAQLSDILWQDSSKETNPHQLNIKSPTLVQLSTHSNTPEQLSIQSNTPEQLSTQNSTLEQLSTQNSNLEQLGSKNYTASQISIEPNTLVKGDELSSLAKTQNSDANLASRISADKIVSKEAAPSQQPIIEQSTHKENLKATFQARSQQNIAETSPQQTTQTGKTIGDIKGDTPISFSIESWESGSTEQRIARRGPATIGQSIQTRMGQTALVKNVAPLTEVTNITQSSATSPKSNDSIILSHIENVIADNKHTGEQQTSFSGNNIITTETDESVVKATLSPVMSEVGILNKLNKETNSSQATTLRKNINNQYLDSKIGRKNSSEQSQQQLMSQQQSSKEQDTTQTPTNITLPTGDEKNLTQVAPQQLSDINTPQPVTEAAKAVTLGPQSQLIEDDIINQVIQRFQLKSQIRSSKMVLRLHPAELGELKIDIAVKEGSVKANFLAQSQQVQDLLERQMPKLKEVMQQQGINVQEMKVSLEADVFSKQGSFQEHLGKKQNFSSKKREMSSRPSFSTSLEQIVADEIEKEDGINVKA